MSKKIQNLFTDIAPNYDFINTVLSLSADRGWRKQAIQELKSYDRYHNVLDLCAGTLAMTKSLLKINPSVKIDAVDFSESMLKVGLEKLPFASRERVHIHCQDAMNLEFPQNTFDGAMCAYGLRNIADNKAVLKSLKKVLKPKGKLVILDFYAPEKIFAKVFQASYANLVIPTLGRLISKNKAAYHHLKNSMKEYYTPTAYRALLDSVGFKNITVKPQSGGISYLITGEAS